MNAIEFENLTKRFGSRTAVEGLSLNVPEGEAFALLGVNGAMIKAHGSSGAKAIKNAITRFYDGRYEIYREDSSEATTESEE